MIALFWFWTAGGFNIFQIFEKGKKIHAQSSPQVPEKKTNWISSIFKADKSQMKPSQPGWFLLHLHYACNFCRFVLVPVKWTFGLNFSGILRFGILSNLLVHLPKTCDWQSVQVMLNKWTSVVKDDHYLVSCSPTKDSYVVSFSLIFTWICFIFAKPEIT